MICIPISPPGPPVLQASETIIALLVFLIEVTMVLISNGIRVRGSMTSMSIPSFANISAASNATNSIRE